MYLKEALDDLYVCATNAKNATLEEGYYEKCYDRIIEELEKQDTEINKLNNVIERIITAIVCNKHILSLFCDKVIKKSKQDCEQQNMLCDDCIKEYFMKQEQN